MDKSKNPPFSPGRKSQPVTDEIAAKIKFYLAKGLNQHDIAAMFGINQGRVSEIHTGQIFPDTKPKQGDHFE